MNECNHVFDIFCSCKESNPVACFSVITSMRSMAIRSPHSDSQLESDGEQICEGVAASPPHSNPSSPLSYSTAPSSNSSTSTAVSGVDVVRPSSPVPRALFTFPQVTALCDRLIREREDQLREEYDDILASKLAGNHMILARIASKQYARVCSLVGITI